MEGRLNAETIPMFEDGISQVLYSWDVLRTTLQNQWGGPHSRQKVQILATDILSWFAQSKEPLYMDDLEYMLYDGMWSLGLQVEDGIIEEFAEKLMILHEECLEGNFKSIEILREKNLKEAFGPHTLQVVNNDEEDDEDDDEDDEDEIQGNPNVAVEMQRPVAAARAGVAAAQVGEDGWTVVSSRRNRGRN